MDVVEAWVRPAMHVVPFLLVLLFGQLGQAGAQVVYVDGMSGNDAQDGLTPQTAVATIDHGGKILAEEGHDQLVVAPGTYYEEVIFEDLGGTEDHPIWIRAETPGTVTISAMWKEAALGEVVWIDEGDGVYSATHGPALFGAHDGRYLFRYNTEVDLRTGNALRIDPGTGDAIVDMSLPPYGFACEGDQLYLRLPADADPNGESILLSTPGWEEEGWLDAVVQISDSPHVIFDGFRVEGSGTSCVFAYPGSEHLTVRNTVLSYCVLGLRLPSYSLVEWSEYTYPGFHDFAEEVRLLNPPPGRGIAGVYDAVKDYHDPVRLEGALAETYSWNTPTSHHCEFRFNLMREAFDGEWLGAFDLSESHHNVYLYNYDNHLELENWAGFPSSELRVHDSLFLGCPMGPLSHQQDAIQGPQYIYRNVIHYLDEHGEGWTQVKSNAPNAPAGAIRYYHNLIQGVDSRLLWTTHDAIEFRNNLILFTHLQDIPEEPPADCDYNILVNDAAKPWLQGLNGKYLETSETLLFQDPDALDFRIAPGSAAEDKGVTLPGFNDDAPGGPDLGPFEVGEEPGPDWPRPKETTYTCEPPEAWPGPLPPGTGCPDVENPEIVEGTEIVEIVEIVEAVESPDAAADTMDVLTGQEIGSDGVVEVMDGTSQTLDGSPDSPPDSSPDGGDSSSVVSGSARGCSAAARPGGATEIWWFLLCLMIVCRGMRKVVCGP